MRNRNRSPFVRIGLRRLARKHPEKRDEIRKVLRDQDLFDAVVESATETYSDTYGDDDGPLINLLNWIVENYEVIFQIITKLLIFFDDKD